MIVLPQDAALDWHETVRAATVRPGAIAADYVVGGIVDGVTLALNDRILIKNQIDPSENGLYAVQLAGAPTRAVDGTTHRLRAGATVYVCEGQENAATAWTMIQRNPVTIGLTALRWMLAWSAGELDTEVSLDAGGSTALALLARLTTDGRNVRVAVGSSFVVDPVASGEVMFATLEQGFARSNGIVTAVPQLLDQRDASGPVANRIVVYAAAVGDDVMLQVHNDNPVAISGRVAAHWHRRYGGA